MPTISRMISKDVVFNVYPPENKITLTTCKLNFHVKRILEEITQSMRFGDVLKVSNHSKQYTDIISTNLEQNYSIKQNLLKIPKFAMIRKF